MMVFNSYYECGFFCCKQKPADELRISDWSSDVCSADLPLVAGFLTRTRVLAVGGRQALDRLTAHFKPYAVIGLLATVVLLFGFQRSEERRVGNACVSKCRSRWSPYD